MKDTLQVVTILLTSFYIMNFYLRLERHTWLLTYL